MRAEARHQLKEDKFSKATLEVAGQTVDWTVEHKSKIVTAAIVVVVLAAAVLGGWYYLNRQDEKASADLAKAVRAMEAPIRPADQPAQPDVQSYTSTKERSTEAHKLFQTVVDHYPHTHNADVARYFLGLTSADMPYGSIVTPYTRLVVLIEIIVPALLLAIVYCLVLPDNRWF